MGILFIVVIVIIVLYFIVKNSSPDELINNSNMSSSYGNEINKSNSQTANYSLKGKTSERYNELKKMADNGNAYAQMSLGDMYYYGENIDKDVDKAIYWYTKSAEQGFLEAQHNLGVAYSNGEEIPQNYDKSIYWFTKAAEHGFDKSQYNLYYIYKNGIGVEKNIDKAIHWLTKAAESGMPVAQRDLGGYYQSEKNHQRILKAYEDAIKEGHDFPFKTFKAFFWVADEEAKKDRFKAMEWYEKAASQGDVESQFLLGALLVGNAQIDENESTLNRGKYWLKKAAENGDEMAQNVLDSL